jgi:hypothetical protein
MIIEFFGVPCCGKSTYSHELAESIRQTTKNVFEIPYEISHNRGRIIRVAKKSLFGINFILRHPNKALRVLCLKEVRTAIRINLLFIFGCAMNPRELYVHDQGVVQSIAAVFDGRNAKPQTVLKLIELLGKDYHVKLIYIRVSPKTVIARSGMRPKRDKPFFYSETGNMCKTIEQCISTTDAISREWCERVGDVLTVNGDCEVVKSHTMSEINDWLGLE